MTRMIKHVMQKKVGQIAKAMGLEGLGHDGACGAVVCLVMMVYVWAMMWVVC